MRTLNQLNTYVTSEVINRIEQSILTALIDGECECRCYYKAEQLADLVMDELKQNGYTCTSYYDDGYYVVKIEF
jgi:hypothetical protein